MPFGSALKAELRALNVTPVFEQLQTVCRGALSEKAVMKSTVAEFREEALKATARCEQLLVRVESGPARPAVAAN